MKSTTTILTGILTLAVATTGCATRKFVRHEIGVAHQRADTLESTTETHETQIEHLQTGLQKTNDRVAQHDEDLEAISETALTALERAKAAGKLAEGKLIYETTLTDGDFNFEFEQHELGESARSALDELASNLKSDDRNVYLEIQGHTDATGPESYNLKLGELRAEATSRYLNMQHGIPLHRMATISYGESAPIADNDSREGRALNRRVVIVVLM